MCYQKNQLKVKATPNVLLQVWDLAAALDPRAPSGTLCVRTLVEHSGRVFRLQFDEFQIVSRCVEIIDTVVGL